jgi:hypothetical protein
LAWTLWSRKILDPARNWTLAVQPVAIPTNLSWLQILYRLSQNTDTTFNKIQGRITGFGAPIKDHTAQSYSYEWNNEWHSTLHMQGECRIEIQFLNLFPSISLLSLSASPSSAFCLCTLPNQKHVVNATLLQAVEAHRVVRCRGSHISRQSANRWRWGCQLYEPAALYPHKDSLYSFLLKALSTPRPQCDLPTWTIVPSTKMIIHRILTASCI